MHLPMCAVAANWVWIGRDGADLRAGGRAPGRGEGQDCDVPVTCADAPPAAPANGTAGTATGSSFGDTVTYDCDGNFRMVGSATSSCGADGEWTPAPTCECESHVLTYDLTGDYYIFAPVVDPFRAAAGENLPAINTLPFGPRHGWENTSHLLDIRPRSRGELERRAPTTTESPHTKRRERHIKSMASVFGMKCCPCWE